MITLPERFEFQAEVKQLLDLMVHSLYSDKDIFLRELVSNGSDALDKLRFEQLTKPELRAAEDLHIRIEADSEKRTLSIIDNGIGMTRDEVVKNIGTIAKSGTKEFLHALKNAPNKEIAPELIGQFGVGFYSSFMVADRVVLTTRRAGEDTATRWESTGDGSFTILETTRDHFGTTVTLHLEPNDPESHLRDYTSEHIIREIVKKYSDFVAYPIRMKTWRTKEGSAAKILEEQTLNSMKAIWARPKAEVTDQEYREFYRHISHDWTEPLKHIPVKIEGTFEANALLYIPSRAPFDLYSPEMKRGVQLYVKRVFIMDECKELMPPHLRFIKGVVDAQDLSLNVSREILQKDRRIHAIRKQLVKKVLGTLEEIQKSEPEKYHAFWAEFGPVLKEGLIPGDIAEGKEKLLELMLACSTHDEAKMTTLEGYAGRMKPDQSAIYYLCGPGLETIRKSPLLEAFLAKGYEVLLFADPIDEIWLHDAPRFKDRGFVSIGKGEIKLGGEEERRKSKEALEERERELKDMLTCIRAHLQDDIKEVRLSNRLTSSAVCLVGDEDDLSPQMQKLLEHMGQKTVKRKRILELNPDHPLLPKLQSMFRENKSDPRLKDYSELLLGQAVLVEAGQLSDPAAFSRLVADLMVRAS